MTESFEFSDITPPGTGLLRFVKFPEIWRDIKRKWTRCFSRPIKIVFYGIIGQIPTCIDERDWHKYIFRLICFSFFSMAVVSCGEINNDVLVQYANQIDSIVVKNDVGLDLSIKDTAIVDILIYPATAELNQIKVKENQLYLQKEGNGKDNSLSSAYSIIYIEKVATSEDNLYRLYIADAKVGYGYKDKVQICYKNEVSLVKSKVIEIKNEGTSLLSFSLSDGATICESFDVKNDTVQIQVPPHFNLKKATVFFRHNGAGVYLRNERQQSGGMQQDFSDFCYPPIYSVKGFNGEEKKYTIEVFNLPIIYINTPDSVAITSRYNWLGNCSFIIRDTDGTIEDYGEANVKGRGNWTWRYGQETGKKPYAIKLANKPKDRTVLGMPGHKRWVLLSNPRSYLPNPIGFEVNRRTETCQWTPRSRFVELILNGKHQGLYLLCEQIKIDKNRVNIKKMRKNDIDGDAITGGYLISYDDAVEDDDPTYRSKYYNMPLMIKNPDTDAIQPEQLEYIKNYINEAELSLYNEERFQNGDFYEYFDVDSWIDYFFAAELWGALEIERPRSVWLYKDRGGKLKAGPIWDLESNFFNQQKLYCTTALYFERLFQSKEVLNRIKNKWDYFRSNLIGNDKYNGIIDYIDSLYAECHYSADRDRMRIPASSLNIYPSSSIDIEYQVIHDNILVKLNWLEKQIMTW